MIRKLMFLTLAIIVGALCTMARAQAQTTISTINALSPIIMTAASPDATHQTRTSTWGQIRRMYGSDGRLHMTPGRNATTQSYPSYCFVLNVPWMTQMPPKNSWDSDFTAWQLTNNCGQACCAMLGAYFNGGSTASWVIDSENSWLGCPRPYGCETGPSTIQRLLLGFHNLHSSSYTGYGPDDVVMEGAHGRPVLVAVRTGMTTTGRPHWMLFIGWDGTYMYFNDPGRSYVSSDWTAGHLRKTPSQFYASWNSFPNDPRRYIPVYR